MKIVIDGNIGAGKTTQLAFLQGEGFKVFKEPIEEWPLKEFYENPKKGIFALQMAVLRTVGDQGPGIYERSLISSRFVFWEWAKAKGLVEHAKTYEYFYDKHAWSPDLYIYLDKSPEACYLAISSRRQTGDDKVTLRYLKELESLYRQIWKHIKCQIYIVNASRKPEEIHKEILDIVNSNDAMFVRDGPGHEVQEPGDSRGEVQRAPCPDMCRMS